MIHYIRLSALLIIAALLLTGCSAKNPPSISPAEKPAASPVPVASHSAAAAINSEGVSVVTTSPSSNTAMNSPGTAAAPSSPNSNTVTNSSGTAAAPGSPSPVKAVTNTFQAASPVSTFSSDDLASLRISFKGTPREIADAIMKWQEDNWFYASGAKGYENVSDPIRWNYFLPGIFTSLDIIRERVKDGKIYGICFDYAVSYCSIANYYGLETRVVNSISKPSSSNPNIGHTKGMSKEEYDRLKIKLDRIGAKYQYEAIRLVAEETPTHYWAEVKIDGQWVIKDATQKATGNDTYADFINAKDFEITSWLSRDRSAELDKYQRSLDKGERLPDAGTSNMPPSNARPPDYAGLTDDLGQTGRAANIDDLLKGWSQAPYFNKVSDAYTFVKASGISSSAINDEQKLKDLYESLSGKKMYTVALLVCNDKTGIQLAEAYFALCGEELDMKVLERFSSYLSK